MISIKIRLVNNTYTYFNRSPKHTAMLESVQSLSGGSSSSFEGSVDAFVSNYGNVVSVFMQENSGKSLSLHKPISSFKFLYVVHFLCDVLKLISVFFETLPTGKFAFFRGHVPSFLYNFQVGRTEEETEWS